MIHLFKELLGISTVNAKTVVRVQRQGGSLLISFPDIAEEDAKGQILSIEELEDNVALTRNESGYDSQRYNYRQFDGELVDDGVVLIHVV